MERNNVGLLPYNFEPEYDSSELLEIQNQINEQSLQRNEVLELDDFCSCGNCCMMTNPWENVCCNGSDLTIGNLDDMECITEHPAFERVVLDRTVLEVAFIQILMYKRSRARAPDELSNTQYRLAAYRQFVSLMMKGEKLGKGNRVVIPSCVTQKIRSAFPSSDNTYCGFKSILDSMNELFQ